MTYIFDDEINLESVSALLEKLDDLSVLYFSSNGGEHSYMKILIDALNRKEGLEVFLFEFIGSAGTYFLTDFKGKLNISMANIILFHKIDVVTFQLRKDLANNKAYLKDLEKENKIYRAKIKKLLTKKQLKKFDKGEDVVVYKKQIEQWKLKNTN